MVSHDSPSDTSSSIVHQFIISDSLVGQNKVQNQQFDSYGAAMRGSDTFPQSLGLLPSLEETMSRSMDLAQAKSVAEESEISHTRHLMDLLGKANESNHQAQRLSLPFNSGMLVPSVRCRQRSLNSDLMSLNYLISGEESSQTCSPAVDQVMGDYSFMGSAFGSSSNSLTKSHASASHGTASIAAALGNSRFLRPAQSLLEEIVSVSGKAVEISNEKYVEKLCCGGRGLPSELRAELYRNDILSAEKHEIQVKLAKLIALVEKVEKRYEKYYHQLEEVVSSFELVSGLETAKPYTALALQAMSRHFCSLRDAIISQIDSLRRKFSPVSPKNSRGLSQLSLLERESRHNRLSLQQLGMIQSQRQTWRPIRGLPESSVILLRSWLFEHFLHPYPNDSEKLMLASQTGLTKNQVSNWFINARVRLWKPMIEEMYKEEFADSSSEDSNPPPSGGSMTREGNVDHELLG